MVALTRSRIRGSGGRVRLWIGDATAIPVRDESYDAVFDFGIIHHVPLWHLALREAHRVLKVGARFYVEEVLAGFIDHPIARYLFHHPRDDRFDAVQLVNGVREAGFVVESNQEIWRAFAWLTATKPRAA